MYEQVEARAIAIGYIDRFFFAERLLLLVYMKQKALILAGSGRLYSHTKALGLAIEKSLMAQGADVQLLELVALELPFAKPEFHRDPSQNPDPKVKELVEQVSRVDAFVILSPVYHNSYAGILKNALDHLSIRQFADKIVGLGSHGGNRTTQAVDQLRIVTRGLNAIAIPTQVCTQDSDFSTENNQLVLSDAAILERVERFTKELLHLSAALKIS